jgi:hypothetical protein
MADTSKPGAVQRRRHTWAAPALAASFALAAGLALGLLQGGEARLYESAPLVWIAITLALVAGSFVAGAIWFGAIDELAQQAHYVAWYWGGSVGLCVAAFLLLSAPALFPLIDAPAIIGRALGAADASTGFIAGVAVSIGALVLGYAAWWLVFWLRRL